MPGLNENRHRRRTVAFRVSDEEFRQIDTRITLSGLPRGEYVRRAILAGKLYVNAGKFQSDRLALELKLLRKEIENQEDSTKAILDCRCMLNELINLLERSDEI